MPGGGEEARFCQIGSLRRGRRLLQFIGPLADTQFKLIIGTAQNVGVATSAGDVALA